MSSFSVRRRPSPDYYLEPLMPNAIAVRATGCSIKLPAISMPGHLGRDTLLCLFLAIGVHGLVAWLLIQSPADIPTTPPPAPVVMQWVAPPVAPPMSSSAPTEPAAATPAPQSPKPVETPAPQKPKPKPAPTQAPKKIAIANKTLSPAQPTEQPVKESAQPPQTVPGKPPASATEPTLVGPYGRAGYLNNPPPTYPPVAARLRQQGVVVLRVHVRADGRPEQVQVFTSSGFDSLDQAAIKAVNQWTFMPAKRGEVATDGWVNVPLSFKLSN
ncbi:energy transducer TonB [Pseudomonas syringae]|uniref:energy transducer TonB n=2 Tax=Pseudomonas TaxID=286 RepID=UPI00269321BB|nr:energy transducer TonB [Pseudomonas syringae]